MARVLFIQIRRSIDGIDFYHSLFSLHKGKEFKTFFQFW